MTETKTKKYTKPGAKESAVEKYLHRRIKFYEGETFKFVSPGAAGVPDRIVIVNGFVFFVEVKSDVGTISSLQTRQLKKIKKVGADGVVVFGKRGVDEFINEYILPIVNGEKRRVPLVEERTVYGKTHVKTL